MILPSTVISITAISSVRINLPVKNLFRQFTYSVPEALQFIDSGWRVVVPFSGQKVEGFVVERVPLIISGQRDGSRRRIARAEPAE